jgi:hypothetical protein
MTFNPLGPIKRRKIMPSLKFTKVLIDKLPFTKGGQVDYFDMATPGLGLRVGQSSKTFFAKSDIRDTSKKSGYKTVKKTLGRYGEIRLEKSGR